MSAATTTPTELARNDFVEGMRPLLERLGLHENEIFADHFKVTCEEIQVAVIPREGLPTGEKIVIKGEVLEGYDDDAQPWDEEAVLIRIPIVD